MHIFCATDIFWVVSDAVEGSERWKPVLSAAEVSARLQVISIIECPIVS